MVFVKVRKVIFGGFTHANVILKGGRIKEFSDKCEISFEVYKLTSVRFFDTPCFALTLDWKG
jgi:hypothetical protein